MFEVGFSELVLIFGLALIVLGPQRLPKLAARSDAGSVVHAPWRANSASNSTRK